MANANSENLMPRHIAFIMDGNNRWARERRLPSAAGHRAGMEAIREVLRCCRDRDIAYVSLFAFSSENWLRSKAEVSALMQLFSLYLKKETKALHDDGVRVRFIGRRDRFAKSLIKQMEHAETLTQKNCTQTLVIAADYGGQWDIVEASKKLAEKVLNGELDIKSIEEQHLEDFICLSDIPKPDLCVRTANEHRISNFMLWQLAYSELFFAPVFWPDFGEADLELALESFANRDRRFGGRNDDTSMDLIKDA